jgi:hypothetical protein
MNSIAKIISAISQCSSREKAGKRIAGIMASPPSGLPRD